ncbi:IS5 family transposase [Verrucomicrobia bacterium LW23]|nr:IS5 family transposase [Verrucomicrobia bacterium LW23]
MELTDAQWERVRVHFPEENLPDIRPGRKPVPTREVLDAVLWILNTGARWRHLPQYFPNYKTVHRRFQDWCKKEVLRNVLCSLANELRQHGKIKTDECYIDGTFSSAKGGGKEIGPTRRGKGVKIMAIVNRDGLPLSVATCAANHHEVTCVQLSFDFYMLEVKPEHLIGDKAYDSDQLDKELEDQGVEMIAPHRKNRKPENKTQDGRALRRYKRRWMVERFFAWLHWQRRVITRFEYYPANFLGFVQLASILIYLKQF